MPINDPEKSENMRKSIRVYSGSSNRPLAQKIAEYLGVELSGLTLKQFANGEIYARYDEVEAALDDTNLRRLAAYIDSLRDETQLIMITHQRRTMEMADVLFGVSMQGDGVTKVISQIAAFMCKGKFIKSRSDHTKDEVLERIFKSF